MSIYIIVLLIGVFGLLICLLVVATNRNSPLTPLMVNLFIFPYQHIPVSNSDFKAVVPLPLPHTATAKASLIMVCATRHVTLNNALLTTKTATHRVL